jgi:hypothetical protein
MQAGVSIDGRTDAILKEPHEGDFWQAPALKVHSSWPEH